MISEGILKRRLGDIFSVDQLFPSDVHIPTRFTVFPEEPAQVCKLIKMAQQDGITLLGVGGGTRLYKSNQITDVAVSFSKLTGKIEHFPADLTITIPAGRSFVQIQKMLGRHGQTIPLNPPAQLSSTVGGIVGANAFGSHRHRYGTARDWVIATTLINDEGCVVKAGAKVVKNVSGYDLNKLYIGSRGTLGFLLDISFQLRPTPERRITFQAHFETMNEALDTAECIRKAPLQVEALVVLNGEWNPNNKTNWTLVLELAGSSGSLETQGQSLNSFTNHLVSSSHLVTEDEATQLWTKVNRKINQVDTCDYYLAKISLSKRNLKLFIKSIMSDQNPPISVKVFPGVGICYVQVPETLEQSEVVIQKMLDEVKSIGGSVEFEILPSESHFERWPILPSAFPWMKKIKKALDPGGIFAPHTFVGGI